MTGHLKQHRNMILSERGVTIAYKQREIVVENIPAVPAKAEFLNERINDRKAKYALRQYTVEFALLTFDKKQIVPKPGDHIIEGDVVYQVTENERQQCYRPIDPDETFVRIFVFRLNKSSPK
jgi:hypothetical protein